MKNVFSRDMIQDNWHQCALYQFSYHLNRSEDAILFRGSEGQTDWEPSSSLGGVVIQTLNMIGGSLYLMYLKRGLNDR